MDLFTFAAQNAPPPTAATALPLQPAQLTCDGCGAKGPVIHIPTLVIPERLWKTYVLEHSGWLEDCRRCQPTTAIITWQPTKHGLEPWMGVRMSNEKPEKT